MFRWGAGAVAGADVVVAAAGAVAAEGRSGTGDAGSALRGGAFSAFAAPARWHDGADIDTPPGREIISMDARTD